jgi:signal transduction histidine kinase
MMVSMWSPGIRLLRRRPDEDRALAAIAWPRSVDVGGPALGLALTIGTLLTAVLFRREDAGIDVVGVGLVVVSGLPWLLSLLSVAMPPPPPPPRTEAEAEAEVAWWRHWCRIEAILVPLTVLNLAGWLGWLDLGSHTAPQFVLFPILIMVALVLMSRPWRTAVVVTGVAYVSLVMGIAASTRQLSELDWTGMTAWNAAFWLTVSAAVAGRRSAVALHQRGEMLAEQATADELRRVARDVHDVVAHTLVVTMLHIQAARLAVDRGSTTDATEALEEAERQGRASLTDVRRLVDLLRADGEPLDTGQPSLGAVQQLVDGYRAAGLPVTLTIDGVTDGVPAGAGLAVYRILQEALSNAARHGDGPAQVQLRVSDGEIALGVDNPVGSAPATNGRRGSGLVGMRERIAAAGGHLTAGRDGGTWRVRASVPVGLPGVEGAAEVTA